MTLDLFYIVRELKYSGVVQEHQYAAGPFKTWAEALKVKLAKNSEFSCIREFQIVKQKVNVELV
jgi:hypothetical protein